MKKIALCIVTRGIVVSSDQALISSNPHANRARPICIILSQMHLFAFARRSERIKGLALAS
jgi:hypothetical protein